MTRPYSLKARSLIVSEAQITIPGAGCGIQAGSQFCVYRTIHSSGGAGDDGFCNRLYLWLGEHPALLDFKANFKFTPLLLSV